MTDKEYAELQAFVSELGQADLSLANFPKRSLVALKELDVLVKKQTSAERASTPVFGQIMLQCKRLSQSAGPAIKAVDKIIKLASDKKKMLAISVADAKKQLVTLGKPIQQVYDDAVGMAALGAPLAGKHPALASMAALTNNSKTFAKQVHDYKLGLGKWK